MGPNVHIPWAGMIKLASREDSCGGDAVAILPCLSLYSWAKLVTWLRSQAEWTLCDSVHNIVCDLHRVQLITKNPYVSLLITPTKSTASRNKASTDPYKQTLYTGLHYDQIDKALKCSHRYKTNHYITCYARWLCLKHASYKINTGKLSKH